MSKRHSDDYDFHHPVQRGIHDYEVCSSCCNGSWPAGSSDNVFPGMCIIGGGEESSFASSKDQGGEHSSLSF